MNRRSARQVLLASILLGLAVVRDTLGGSAEQSTAEIGRSVSAESRTELSGEELWSNNCQRCHNIRSPSMYSSAQWDVIVHHMRVRANITGAEQRAITDFLKAASH